MRVQNTCSQYPWVRISVCTDWIQWKSSNRNRAVSPNIPIMHWQWLQISSKVPPAVLYSQMSVVRHEKVDTRTITLLLKPSPQNMPRTLKLSLWLVNTNIYPISWALSEPCFRRRHWFLLRFTVMITSVSGVSVRRACLLTIRYLGTAFFLPKTSVLHDSVYI